MALSCTGNIVWHGSRTFTQYVSLFTIVCMVFHIIKTYFVFIYFPFLRKENKFVVISLYHLCVGPLSTFQPLDYFYYALYECYAVGGHPNAVLLSFLQFVIKNDIHVGL
jgi:hypothetical protein